MKNKGIMLAGIMGIIGGILMIVSVIAGDDRFSDWLYLVAAVCILANFVGLILNYKELKKIKEKEEAKQQQ